MLTKCQSCIYQVSRSLGIHKILSVPQNIVMHLSNVMMYVMCLIAFCEIVFMNDFILDGRMSRSLT